MHLPNAVINGHSQIETAFIKEGCNSFHAACEYVKTLPYGRTSRGADCSLVLSEQRGTCSSKHAILKVLADQLSIDLKLMVGIYQMNEENTPGVGSVLDLTDYDFIPEAHCYLKSSDHIFDFTRAAMPNAPSISEFLLEVEIEPSDIGSKKREIHIDFLRDQYGDDAVTLMWGIRERCIKTLELNEVR